MNKNNVLFGGLLIALGIIFLGAKTLFGIDIINLGPGDFWPLIIIMVGIVFESVYFVSGSKPAFLVPGGILTTVGLLHMFEVSTDFRFSEYTWPIYIVAVAVGLYQLYIFGGRSRGVFIAASILMTIAAISLISILFEIFTSVISISYFIAIILILAGLLLVFGRRKD
jgi:hypothetical protein